MDRDVYAKLIAKLKEMATLMEDIQTDIETLNGKATISTTVSGSYIRFIDSNTGILIAVNPVTNRLAVSDGTNDYYFTLTPYNP